MAQIIRAGKELWTIMSPEVIGPWDCHCRGEESDGASMQNLMYDPRFVVHLVAVLQSHGTLKTPMCLIFQGFQIPRPMQRSQAKTCEDFSATKATRMHIPHQGGTCGL